MYEDFIKNYDKLREENNNLPEMSEIENEYEIKSAIVEKNYPGDFPERIVRRTITSLLNSVIGHLHNFIMPSQYSAISNEESGYLSEDDKNDIIQVISKIMILLRVGFKCELEKNKTEDIKFIIDSHKQWMELKKEISSKIPILINGWKDSINKKDDKTKYHM